ncbi:hypothetical protein Cgig2_010644 [Carnegiea gigantea]|uniref:Reverse transcriptase zinc-binding domain-containing protein n=1 Tax=Carnegiea gigantea TaxID=171969 RepID=A0A9Q1JRV0_9CARY|nr:hypothetical protein Cgig2_010644 [Carnegiea gigantea]
MILKGVLTKQHGIVLVLIHIKLCMRRAFDKLRQNILQQTGFSEGSLCFRYPGVLMTLRKLCKMECKVLVDKMTYRIKTSSSKHIPYADRVILINSVLLGLYSFGASIFMLQEASTPSAGISFREQKLYIRDHHTFHRRRHNEAYIAKLVWDIGSKKDIMWVKWVYKKYIGHQSWQDYTLKYNEAMQSARVSTDYKWVLKGRQKVNWHRFVWIKTTTPKHVFPTWLIMADKLSVKVRY